MSYGPPRSSAVLSGDFVATFVNAGTPTPTMQFYWTLAGRVVTLAAAGGINVTSDSTAFSTAPGAVPAMLVPTDSKLSQWGAVRDNNVNLVGALLLVPADASLRFALVNTTNGTTSQTWVASGNKAVLFRPFICYAV